MFVTKCDDTDINSAISKEEGKNTSIDSGNDTMSSSQVSDFCLY